MNERIVELKGLYPPEPTDAASVEDAQKKLGVTFAEDYKLCLLTYGLLSAQGIELSGITTVKDLDVVKLTEIERRDHALPEGYYVIEPQRIDDITAVQDVSGAVFFYQRGKMSKVAQNLEEYLFYKQQ